MVTCERRDDPVASRVAGLCQVQGQDPSAWMVALGHALASRPVGTAYLNQEGRAWATRRGIGSGTFEKPADWRQGLRRVEASAGSDPAE